MPPKRKTALRKGGSPGAWRESASGRLDGGTSPDADAESMLLDVPAPPAPPKREDRSRSDRGSDAERH